MSSQEISTKNGAYILFDTFVRHGVEYIFGYPGGAILPIYDELFFWEKAGLLKHILVRHEQGASHAADGYARSSNKVGVCFATSGPGATNLVTGIATAQMDSIPLVIVTGQVGRSFLGTDAFQETDIFGITLPIVKHSYVVRHASELEEIVTEALYLAQNGRPSPVLIDIPKDVGVEKVPGYNPLITNTKKVENIYRFDYSIRSNILKTVITLIKGSSQPLLYVGGGALKSKNCSLVLKTFIRCFNIPITTTLMGKGIYDEKNIQSLGMLGMHGTAYANFAVSECDLLIALGSRFDDRVTGKLDQFAALAKIIHVDIDPAEIGKNKLSQIPLMGDVKKIMHELLKNTIIKSNKPTGLLKYWNDRVQRWQSIYPLVIPSRTKLTPQQVISLIGKTYPKAIFTTDVGQHQMWSAQFINLLPKTWISSAGLGTMGFGLPAAIGAAFAFQDRDIICITGDSSFQMCLQELATARIYNLPIKIFIINNNWQGMVRQWQESFYGKRYSHSYMENNVPNFSLLANSFGIKSIEVNNLLDFNKLLVQLQKHYPKEIVLIDIKVESEENCYPMVTPGKSNAQMLGIDYIEEDIVLE